MADDDEAPSEDQEGEADDFNYIVRIAATDLDGNKPVFLALSGVKGIGERVANILTEKAGVQRDARIGELPDEDIEAITEQVDQIAEIIPAWMLNRRKDIATGEDQHLLRQELDTRLREDLNRLKKIRAYRGIRHERGQKVRGQRTRANGREGTAMGVSRQRVQAEQ